MWRGREATCVVCHLWCPLYSHVVVYVAAITYPAKVMHHAYGGSWSVEDHWQTRLLLVTGLSGQIHDINYVWSKWSNSRPQRQACSMYRARDSLCDFCTCTVGQTFIRGQTYIRTWSIQVAFSFLKLTYDVYGKKEWILIKQFIDVGYFIYMYMCIYICHSKSIAVIASYHLLSTLLCMTAHLCFIRNCISGSTRVSYSAPQLVLSVECSSYGWASAF